MKIIKMLLCALLLWGLTFLGCGRPTGSTGAYSPGTLPKYLNAADGSGDRPDFDCAVTLRSVGRIQSGPGYATTCDLGDRSGSCLYVWEGFIDVDASLAGQVESVGVLFKTGQTGGQWYVSAAEPIEGADNGFLHYAFRIDRYTPAAGMSMTSLNRTVIELIPYVRSPNGSRLFDHNRIKHPLHNYLLTLDNRWTMDDAPAICTPVNRAGAELLFSYPAFEQSVINGPVSAGKTLKVRYDGRRLRERHSCLGSQGPVSATTVMMGWMVNGEGQRVREERVESYRESYGYACAGESPCITHEKFEPQLAIPEDARSIQMWFYCVPGFSQGQASNWRYDSNFGSNYSFEVAPLGQPVDWAGGWTLHAARSGFRFPLNEPYLYRGFTNMGYSLEAQVYVSGLTDQPEVDDHLVKAFVETDLTTCTPGGEPALSELILVGTHQGDFNNNNLYRWHLEAALMHCPKGDYRFRFLFSADGGRTFRVLGNAESTSDAGAGNWRHINYE